MQTTLEHVTVYRNGALVVRAGTTDAADVVVDGLPLLFSSDSVRVRPAAGRVLDLEEKVDLGSAPGAPPEARDALVRARLALEGLRARERAITELVTALDAVTPSAPADVEAEGVPSLGGWLQARERHARSARELEGELGALRRERDEAVRALRTLEAVGAQEKVPPRVTRGLSFRLADAPVGTRVEVEYFVEAARWVPTYRLEVVGGEATLALSALLAQASGEDWDGARLSVSTADLSRDATLPEMSSWRLGRAQPARRPAFRPLPEGLDELFAGYDAARRLREPPKPSPQAHGGRADKEVRRGKGKKAAVVLDESEGAAMDLEAFDDEIRTQESYPLEAMSLADDAPAADFGPPPPAAQAASRSAPMMAKARAVALPAAAASGMARMANAPARAERETRPVRPPEEPLPPRLRFAYLRLGGPDEGGRGTLQPLDMLSHLSSLASTHRLDAPELVRRAVTALQEASARMRQRGLPSGAVPLGGTHFQHVYAAAGTHAVPTDGHWHAVNVLAWRAPADIEHRAVPRASEDVYRFCLFHTPTGTPLPAGPMQVFVDGSYRVTSPLRGTGGGEQMPLNLGIDPDVRITGRTVHVAQEEKGLVSQNSRVEHRVRVPVRSSAPYPVRVVLFDRLPVADDNQKDISVVLGPSTPEPTRVERSHDDTPLKGGLRFVLTVGPDQLVNVEYSYVISLPAKAELTGGNRRE